MWLGIMLATYLAGLVMGAWQNYLLERTGQAFVRDIRKELFAKFQHQSLGYHHDHSTGELVTRMTGDVDAMEQSVLQGLTTLLEEVVTFFVVAAMVLWLSPVVGAASILPLAFAFVFIRSYNRRVKSVYEGVRRRLGTIGSFLQDRLAGIQVTQSFAKEAVEEARFAERADGFFETSVAASRLRNTYFPVVSFFGFLNNLVMLGVGSWLIMRGSEWFTLGALIAYRGFWWRLQSPIRTIAQTSDILQRARASALRVMELLDAAVGIEDAPQATAWDGGRGSVAFRDVAFAYVPGTPILKGLSFDVAADAFVAIAGGSGSRSGGGFSSSESGSAILLLRACCGGNQLDVHGRGGRGLAAGLRASGDLRRQHEPGGDQSVCLKKVELIPDAEQFKPSPEVGQARAGGGSWLDPAAAVGDGDHEPLCFHHSLDCDPPRQRARLAAILQGVVEQRREHQRRHELPAGRQARRHATAERFAEAGLVDREELLDRVEFLAQRLGLGSPGEAESQIVTERRRHRLHSVGVVPAGEYSAQRIEEKVGLDLLAEPLELARPQGEEGRGRLPPRAADIGPLLEHEKQRAPESAESEAIDGHGDGIPLEDHGCLRHDSADHQRKHRHIEQRHGGAGPDHARPEGPAAESLQPRLRVDPGQDPEEHGKARHPHHDQPEPARARWKQPVAEREHEGRDACGHQAEKRHLRRPAASACPRFVCSAAEPCDRLMANRPARG